MRDLWALTRMPEPRASRCCSCRSLDRTRSEKVKLTSDNFDEWSSNGTNELGARARVRGGGREWDFEHVRESTRERERENVLSKSRETSVLCTLIRNAQAMLKNTKDWCFSKMVAFGAVESGRISINVLWCHSALTSWRYHSSSSSAMLCFWALIKFVNLTTTNSKSLSIAVFRIQS